VEEAHLEKVESGLAPVSEGWFVVNIGEAAWLSNDVFGARCIFEGSGRVLQSRPDLTGYSFPEVGFSLQVLEPEQPSGMYHAETGQENFLVLVGECLLIVEEEERALRPWDFVHCPPGTHHVFVGAGDGLCVIFMTGARNPDRGIVYPRSEVARNRGAGVEEMTESAHEAYAPFPHWQPARPANWSRMPWA
jgi:uncharacterized cupin superfamily protein